MKKICVLLLIVCTVLWICGCSAPAPQPTESGFALPAESGFVLTVADCTITMGAEAAPILAALGKPVTVTEEASCAFDGTEKTYRYEHFCLTTCPVDGAEIICRVWFTDDSLSTAEGIRVGSSRDAVAQTYGGDVFKDDGLCVLNRGESSLTILLANGAVTSVQYALIIK